MPERPERSPAEPLVDGGDVEGGFVADGELVVSGGDGAVALEPADPAFHGVAGLVQFRVEAGRPATGAALVLAVADLVGFLRDRAGDLRPPQVRAVGPGPVGLVRQHPARPGPRVPAARPRDADALQHGLELRGVPPLASRDHDGQRPLPCSQARCTLVVSPPRDRRCPAPYEHADERAPNATPAGASLQWPSWPPANDLRSRPRTRRRAAPPRRAGRWVPTTRCALLPRGSLSRRAR